MYVTGVSIKSWKELKKISPLRNIVLLNGSFWFALSGSQMTLLPLLLVSPDLHLTTPQIGGTFAAMSLVSFLASQPSAYLADKYGKERGILSGCAFVCLSGASLLYGNRPLLVPFIQRFAPISVTYTPILPVLLFLAVLHYIHALLTSKTYTITSSIIKNTYKLVTGVVKHSCDLSCAVLSLVAIALSHATDFSELLTALFPLAIGSTVMNSTPAALVGDLSSTSQRSQGID
jgi:hypothetical protein